MDNAISIKENKCHVRFGNGHVLIGLYTQGSTSVVSFRDSKDKFRIGEGVCADLDKNATSVFFSFENIESLEVLIDTLNRLADAMRVKESPFIEAS